LFRPEAIEKLLAEHTLGKREHSFRLWALVMLELWFRTHLDPRASQQ
jgi:asparagine synthase (glutamine-hydrolysing)